MSANASMTPWREKLSVAELTASTSVLPASPDGGGHSVLQILRHEVLIAGGLDADVQQLVLGEGVASTVTVL